MFGRKKDETAAEQPEVPHRDGAKNRPTPKRKDQEAARRQPLVVTDRREARRQDRERRRAAQAKQMAAMRSGDESALPPRDKGPARRFIRDYVDARRSLGEYLLPAMIIVIVTLFIRTPLAQAAAFVLVYALLIATIIDSFFMWRRIKKSIVARFGADKLERGMAMYAVMRSMQIRRTRLPKPMVERGQFPAGAL